MKAQAVIEEEEVTKALYLIRSLTGQAIILGFLSVIALSELSPTFEDLRVIPALILVFFAYKIYLRIFILLNKKEYYKSREVLRKHYNNQIDE